MAAVTKHFGTVALVSNGEVSVTLDERYAYHIRHTGLDASGNDDANSAGAACLSRTSGKTVDMSEADDKFVLTDGKSIEIGPGIATLYVSAALNVDAILLFSRRGLPTRTW